MDVGPRQGSALRLLLLIAVLEISSRKRVPVVVADDEADLLDRLVEWKEIFGNHRLRLSLEKKEVL